MTKAARFTQLDLTRAVKGVTAAGYRVAKARIMPNGEIEVLTEGAAANDTGRNPLDRLFTQ